MGWDLETLKIFWYRVQEFMRLHPWLLFVALVILPGLPVPTSALLFLTGTIWGEHPVAASSLAIAALAINMSWCYWLASGPGREIAGRWFSRTDLPILPAGDSLRTILLLRLTPGLPLFAQNYLLGFLRVPFGQYIGVSLLCNGVLSVAVILAGAGIAGGDLGTVLTGISIAIVATIAIKWIREKLIRRNGARA